ncbi:ArsR/SmtB family transcription factor [Phenylobacterium immobile]|uniref:ArsR/SmtB family transcription factor n=1 Tax=Phenylobacterium immobile TaxID=21 RepID=UPI001FDF0820|nr:metalloregulator ArsR/SmtB family transcription factor [Phenylobacterium immobile]
MNETNFDVLADPTRRRILAALRDGERPVGDLVREAGIRQSGVSRHLGILEQRGFVAARPEGQRRLYSLRPEPFAELEAWLADYRRLWEARLDRFGAALEAQTTSSEKTPR